MAMQTMGDDAATARTHESVKHGTATTPTPDELASTALLFHGLSDPTRLTILRHLATGEHRVRDLTEHLGLAQSTVSAHLACLRDCGLVTSRPVGRANHFSLTHEAQTFAVLQAAGILLAQSSHQSTGAAHEAGSAHRAEPAALSAAAPRDEAVA